MVDWFPKKKNEKLCTIIILLRCGSVYIPADLQAILVLALTLRHLVSDGVVARLPDLGLEVKVDKLVLLGLPLAIGVAVVNNLAAAGVADLNSSVGEGAVSRPLKVVAAALGNEERLGAADVALLVEALLNGVVHDFALGDGLACRKF